MGEFELIKRYLTQAQETLPESVVLGVGDDAALLQPDCQQQLVVAVDTLVADVHFPAAAPAEDVGQRALRVNLSDLAAMGATPAWFTLALTLPDTWSANQRREWLQGFSIGLQAAAQLYGCVLVGGDTTAGPLSLTIQVMGQVPPGQALRRDGASVGDFILVTHTLGDGAAALAHLDQPDTSSYLYERFYRPTPRLGEGQLLRGLASAALDVSDGLLADLAHLCHASDVAAIVDVEQVPLSETLQAMPIEQSRQWALSGGDDYELVFTLAPERMETLARLQAQGQIQATVIGQICAGSGVHCELDGQEYSPARNGYQHFS